MQEGARNRRLLRSAAPNTERFLTDSLASCNLASRRMASALRQGSSYRLDPYSDSDFQFGRPVVTRPWKKVALAIGLLIAGTVLLSVGLGLYLTGHKASSELAMVILGSLCFIPGSYHTYIAWKAWYRVDGYDLNQIPDW